MKIVQLVPYAMDRPGGVQRHVRDLSVWLNAHGHETRIVAPPAPGRAPWRDSLVTEIGRARRLAVHGTAFEISLASPWAVRRLAQELHTWGAEVAHLHTPWTPALVGQVASALGLPRVTTIHATLPDSNNTGWINRYIRRSAQHHLDRSAKVIVPSFTPKEALQAWRPNIATSVIPPGIDLSHFSSGEKRPKSCLFLGRLEPRKGLDIALAAWPAIHKAHPDARLTIAGDGPMRDQINDLAGAAYVGAPSDADVKALMSQADIFLAPAPYGESYGLVLAEACASGAIPIAAGNPGYASFLERYTKMRPEAPAAFPDLLAPPGDAEAFAARAIALLNADRDGMLRSYIVTLAGMADINGLGPQFRDAYTSALGTGPSLSSRP